MKKEELLDYVLYLLCMVVALASFIWFGDNPKLLAIFMLMTWINVMMIQRDVSKMKKKLNGLMDNIANR